MAHATPRQDYQFVTSAFVKKRYFNSKNKAKDAAPDGALGELNIAWDQTHTGKWYIEQQRGGFDAIAAGIDQADPASIERGLTILEWGLKQQREDGSFDCPDSFHSASFFVEAVAHAALLLQNSPYAASYRPRIEALKSGIIRTAWWMARPDIEPRGKKNNAPYTHRRYLVAAALGETGVLFKDTMLLEKSREYIREGVALQNPTGFNPEKGGFDTSYHAVGLYFAEVYYTVVADPITKAELTRMLKKGMNWLKSRIEPDGSINGRGNTRTGGDQELSRTGDAKTLNYGHTLLAFAYYAQITGDRSWLKLADRVAEASRIPGNKFIH